MRAYADFFDAHPDAVVAGGRIIAEYVTGRPAWLSKYTEMPIANPMDFGDAVRPFPAGRVPGGGNMAFRRSAALRYGGFDPSLGRVGRASLRSAMKNRSPETAVLSVLRSSF